MNNILLEEAIRYAERGWFVFPTRPMKSKPFEVVLRDGTKKTKTLPAKSPYYKGGFMNATRDVEQIKEWWKKHPEAGIGISCGHSGLVVVDIDVKDGRKGFDNFMSLNISDEGALHASTPSGGLHIIYSGSTNSYANIKSGVDLRSVGSYIVAPPSYIYDCEGKKKKYVRLDDWDRTPMEVPIYLFEKLDTLKDKTKPEKKQGRTIITEDLDKTIEKAKKALDKLPQEFCENYFQWIEIGLSLKSLGDAGYELWKEWSKKSSKYEEDACEYRWERFDPRDITIASLLFYAKEASR
jgi:hypothetical protein